METALLRSFAVWARTTLVGEVSARIAVVLGPGAAEGVEQPKAVDALRRAVSSAGGGLAGVGVVADKVAYTWFNRIVALRFMDANGYTGLGVVSPERGRGATQPEVLAEAKRGNFDLAVIGNRRTVETVTSLLDGTRRSQDPQGEAYALLMAEYCRHWNLSMPFMFEREGDYTELLIPSDLLADDSVRARAVAVLTEEVCRDVEVIGWLYQFYVSERKDEIFAGFKKNKKAGAAEIPAATQLFTPHWIVRYLVENSLGRLWLLNRPTSRLAGQMEYYIAPVDEETDFLKVLGPEELKVIDPACGSGHMLTYAFDLLYAIYEEEGYAPSDIPALILTNNLYGTEIDPRAGALAAFALTMKARARQRTFFNTRVEPNICVLEPISFTPHELETLVTPGGDRLDEEAFWNQFEHADTLGSLIQPSEELIAPLRRHLDTHMAEAGDIIGHGLQERALRVLLQAEYLSQHYNVIVANPPYMGARNMSSLLASGLEASFDQAKNDLFAAFVVRMLMMAVPLGQVAIMSPNVWMHLSSYMNFRQLILQNHLATLVELPLRGFSGATVQICAYVLTVGRTPAQRSSCLRLVDSKGGDKDMPLLARAAIQTQDPALLHAVNVLDFAAIPGAPLAFAARTQIVGLFSKFPLLKSVAPPVVGLQTGENERFLRFWWEVGFTTVGMEFKSRESAQFSGRRWFPYNKGGAFRRWYGNSELVVDWEEDGSRVRANRPRSAVRNASYYFREGITWSDVSSGLFSARFGPAGSLFDVKGSSAFPSAERLYQILALLNSNLAIEFFKILSPTVSFQTGDIAKIPVAGSESLSGVEPYARSLVNLSKNDWDADETSWGFTTNGLVGLGDPSLNRAVVRSLESRASDLVEAHGLEEAMNRLISEAYDVAEIVPSRVPLDRISLTSGQSAQALIAQLVSYGVGCMFGRYGLDEPGLILANQGETLRDYLARVPDPSFMPDADNVIPIVDGEWFEDDIVARFRQFLRAAFGEQHFEENLRFVTESLGVKDLREYFVKSFYKDHVQRYKKRPIYWLFSSPKGSFNALIYMHRYTPSTVSTVLNEYLREFTAKLEASRQHHERLAAGGGTPRAQAAAQKEVDRLRKVLLELGEYEHDVLYPLATREVQIDLDDGVKTNYPKFGAALKKIPGLEVNDE